MKTVLVTGATGILGSNVCTMLIAKGYKPRAIARNMLASDVRALERAGVDVVPGDLTDLHSLESAAWGVDGVIHSAAMLARPGASWEGSWASNVLGTVNVLTAAARQGGAPVIQVITTTFFDQNEKVLSERSPMDIHFRNEDMYSTTKRLAYAEGYVRASEGQDIRFMIPGAIYGPSICREKAMEATTFNDCIASAVRGEMPPGLPLPMPWSTAGDCAYVCIAALERGERGQRYIAHGVPEESGTMASVCNIACALAGFPHRVEEIPKAQLDTPEMIARFGPTMPLMAARTFPNPISDSRFTQEALGYTPTSLKEGLSATLAWMRSIGAI